ncbi:MAG: C25 family cysteine peptidase [Paludibacter sp.]
MLYDRATTANNPGEKPKYLLLFGRGSFDNRKILTDSGDNLVLTYQADNSLNQVISYMTDDYFSLLNDNDGVDIAVNLMDAGVGRFPVTTVQQATNVVNKTIGYMNNSTKGYWKSNLCFLADDGAYGYFAMHADSVAAVVERTAPAFHINKVFMDTYQQQTSANGEFYPNAKTSLMNLFQSGLFMFNYTGFGAPTALTNEKIITDSIISGLTNQNLPLWFGATSDFAKFDGKTVSAGEKVLLNPGGGGIGVLSATRPCYASQNFNFNKAFCTNLFKKVNGTQLRMGDVISSAKNQLGSEINKLSFVYLGDPAIKLNYPGSYNILTTRINNSTTFGTDTLKALSANTIQGIVANGNGNRVSGFNGNLHVELFDKIERISTLNNDKDAMGTPYVFSDRPVALYTGDVQVVDGAFSVSFKMPKDINLNFGTGRIIYYAQDDTNNNEAQGYFENFIVGGTDLKSGLDFPTGSNGFTVSNQPNPFSNQTRFVVGYSSPETVVNATVEIFDLSGRKIKSICQSSIDNLTWDLSTSSGGKANAGVYVYRVVLKTDTRNVSSGYNKLIIID